MQYVRSITVEDASGARFVAFEYQRRGFLVWERRFMLDTGEPLELVDNDTFAIVATGERLVRV